MAMKCENLIKDATLRMNNVFNFTLSVVLGAIGVNPCHKMDEDGA